MAALAPAAHWIPEDDLLLKNAVEAGGSLESLAKGAVRFSQRYTLRELQQRWYSLLYDPFISAEASVHMIELERSASKFPSGLSKLGNSKESWNFSKKRKSQSVRSSYYALRKRVRNEPFNSEGFKCLVRPGNGRQLRTGDDTVTGDHTLGDPNLSLFYLQESDFEILRHAFPNILMDGVINTTNALRKDAESPTEGFPVEQDDLSKEMPGPLGRETCCMELFETNSLDAKLLPAFDPMNHNGENVCQQLEQDHAFNFSFLDSGASFHGLDFLSPLPNIHIWKDAEDISPPLDIRQNFLSLEDAFSIEDRETYNADQSVVSAKGYLADLSRSLLDFTNEEELLSVGVDAKALSDKSYYDDWSSLLLNSPVDVNQGGDTLGFSEAVTSAVASKTDLVSDNICKSEEFMVSNVSGTTTQFSETCHGFMFCTLNMEDPEIPCNADVVFSKTLATSQAFTKAKSRLEESRNCISSHSMGKELLADAGSPERVPSISPGHYDGLLQLIGSQVSMKNSFNQTVGASLGTSEVSSINHDANLPDRIDPSTFRLDNFLSLTLEEPVGTSRIKHLKFNPTDSALDRPLSDSDKFQCQRLDEPHKFLDPLDSGMDLNSSALGQIESDDDLPYFPDVEAMILDMDLDPDDQDLRTNERVLQYNDEAARMKIVRLEQGAHSYMQRAIASHGAFAILYGRYSKFYIRKQEVLIGRGSEDFIVDIDLRKEGLFRKVSRQQALIKLQKNGSFLLENLSNKFPILVNDKPVAPGMSMTLTPNCLILRLNADGL